MTTINKKEALLCAKISHSTYGKGYDIDEFKLKGRFENKGTDTQGIFGVTKNALILAFRGSEETGAADWITDLNLIPANYPYSGENNSAIKVHAGFIEAYQSVRDAMYQTAKESPLKQIICTGHSLGGSLATLCALDIRSNLPDKQVSCYTYGSPKVGNPDFVKVYNQHVPQTFRFVNGPDVIPTIPPDVPFLVDYEHVGNLYHIGDTQVSRLSTNTAICHLPKSYIEVLEKGW
jgi:triacylglycerol lipase